jgi:hypothetical protein
MEKWKNNNKPMIRNCDFVVCTEVSYGNERLKDREM